MKLRTAVLHTFFLKKKNYMVLSVLLGTSRSSQLENLIAVVRASPLYINYTNTRESNDFYSTYSTRVL